MAARGGQHDHQGMDTLVSISVCLAVGGALGVAALSGTAVAPASDDCVGTGAVA